MPSGSMDWRNLDLDGIMQLMKLTAVYVADPEGGYSAFVEELPGANTQGATLEEARANLTEAVEMVLEANRVLAIESLGATKFISEPLVLAGV